jgi:hypothetical protein
MESIGQEEFAILKVEAEAQIDSLHRMRERQIETDRDRETVADRDKWRRLEKEREREREIKEYEEEIEQNRKQVACLRQELRRLQREEREKVEERERERDHDAHEALRNFDSKLEAKRATCWRLLRRQALAFSLRLLRCGREERDWEE